MKRVLWYFYCYNRVLIKLSTVVLWTPKIRAISHLDTFLSNKTRITSSWPESFTRFDLLPFGRPRTTPSARLLANASFVLWLIKFRSISALKPNANARTLL